MPDATSPTPLPVARAAARRLARRGRWALAAAVALVLALALALPSAAQPLAPPDTTVAPAVPAVPGAPAAPAASSAALAAPAAAASGVHAPTGVWGRSWRYVRTHAEDYVGYVGASGDWPFRQQVGVYRAAPVLRYNRAEGLVAGVQRQPLAWSDDERARVYGQVAYATALRDVRYTAGLETRIYETGRTGLKVGAAYRQNTTSNDVWKASWLENSLAALTTHVDYFDYYEVEGGTAYAVQRLGAGLQLSAGARVEAVRSLRANTDWSVFRGAFRANPAVDDGRTTAAVLALEAGHVNDRDAIPRGRALRIEATAGRFDADDPLMSRADGAFQRVTADGRLYVPTGFDAGLALRLRGGWASAGAPLQEQFTLGGVGSVRAFDQNAFLGPRFALANAEYLLEEIELIDDVFDDLFLAVFADAGWVGAAGQRFAAGDVLPSAGAGLGLWARQVRLDVAWPLRDVAGTGYAPSFRLRLAPNF